MRQLANRETVKKRHYITPWRGVLLALLTVECVWLIAPPPGAFVDRWYSQGLYRWVMAGVSALQNASPVSLTSLLLTGLVAFLIFTLVRISRKLRKDARSRWHLLPWGLGLLAQWMILLGFWMLLLWGAGYQRTPVAERWVLNTEILSAAESAQLEAALLEIIGDTIEKAQKTDRDEAIVAIAVAMEQLLLERGENAIQLPRQVRETPAGLFLATSTGGMCVPVAVEPFVDGAYDPVTFTQVAAHELGHVAGYNRESEATLLGYLAGLRAENSFARYAVALDIYMDLIRRTADPAAYRVAWERLPLAAREDVESGWKIADHYRIKIALFQRVGYHVYDTYLKAQGIPEGMANYSVGLRLFSGAWRQGLIEISRPETMLPIKGDRHE